MTRSVSVGTRGSALALTQTGLVVSALQALRPGLDFTTHIIHTQGDRNQHASLQAIGGQGAFVAEIEAALLRGEIDLAVHSLKDLPAAPRPGLALVPALERGDPRDALVARDGVPLAGLPPRARVGTGSARRIAQLRELRPDLDILDIRGNVDTRLRKLDAGDYDAVVLAAAGLSRLELLDRVTEYFPIEDMIPAPGQGILAAQTRDDEWLNALLAPLAHGPTQAAARAERAFLARLGAGCQLPVAAHAVVSEGGVLTLHTLLGGEAGAEAVREVGTTDFEGAAALGEGLAEAALRRLEAAR
ncbi:MAG: hydroxymethylbilane synthase [Anaerolineae bacterium]